MQYVFVIACMIILISGVAIMLIDLVRDVMR